MVLFNEKKHKSIFLNFEPTSMLSKVPNTTNLQTILKKVSLLFRSLTIPHLVGFTQKGI